jgi:hypothetical protein
MNPVSARLDALHTEELRRLRGDFDRLVEAVGQTGRALVVRHPLAAIGSASVVGVLFVRKITRARARGEAPDTSPRELPPYAKALAGFLRTSLLGVLSAALREMPPPEVERRSSVESELE